MAASGPPRRPVRLTLDPSSDPAQDSFLTIHPPLDWSGSAGEHISAVCRALFGSPTVQIRHAEPSAAMDQAIATARAGLTDIRGRFESGALDLREKLLVKYALPSDRGTEYLWAYVTSWRDPYRILATSAADAVYQPEGAGRAPGRGGHRRRRRLGGRARRARASSRAPGPRPRSTRSEVQRALVGCP